MALKHPWKLPLTIKACGTRVNIVEAGGLILMWLWINDLKDEDKASYVESMRLALEKQLFGTSEDALEGKGAISEIEKLEAELERLK